VTTRRLPRWRARLRRAKRIRRAALALAAFAFSLPIFWTLLASFGVRPQAAIPSVERYFEIGIAENRFWMELLTSACISAMATALGVGIAFMAAYGLVRTRFLRKAWIAQLFLVLASMPAIAYIIPLDGAMRTLRLSDTQLGLILAQAAIFSPLALYVFHGQLRRFSPDYEEAARLDGASLLRILARIVAPMNAQICIATAIVLFSLNWNSFLVPLVVTTNHVRTIPLAMSDFFVSDRELEWPTAATALVASLVPLVGLAALAHRSLERFFVDWHAPMP
jgi:multiple sugar transport system permease protein